MSDVYNLNGKVRIIVDAPARYRAYFRNEYARISTDHTSADCPDVTLKLVDAIDPAEKQSVHYKGLFRFNFAVRDLAGPSPVLLFEKHWLDRFYVTAVGAFVQGQLLEPILYQKLLETDVLFMHAAGVSKDGKAFVFPAEGGTGKTTLSLSLMQNGYALMGDDLLMVDAQTGLVFPYARPLHLFTYNLKTLRPPLRIQLAIAAKDVIRTAIAVVTGRRFLISTRAHAEEIFETTRSGPAPLQRVVFLQREGDSAALDLTSPQGVQQATDAIIGSADLNTSLMENIGMSPETGDLERSVIQKALRHVDQLQFVNARDMRSDHERLAFAEAHLV
ncbi:MAG: hypothetical protein AAF224_11645 [Pseudomonadota bacterium]